MTPNGTAYISKSITQEALADVHKPLIVFRIMRKDMRYKLADIGVSPKQHAVHWLRLDPRQSMYEYVMLVPGAANGAITADDKMRWRTGDPFARRRICVRPVRSFVDA
jgi:hypothetical protein